jgi:hypothetical protein
VRRRFRWTPLLTRYPVQAEIAKEFKSDARYFIRLDLGYLAAAAVLVGVLRIAPPHIPDIVADYLLLGFLYLALLSLDTAIYALAHEHWIAAKQDRLTRWPQWLLCGAVSHQPWLHVCFIGFVISGGLGFSTGMHHGHVLRTARIEIQAAIDSFYVTEKHYPISIEELTKKDPTVSTSIRNLDGELFDYQPVGASSYRLRFWFGAKSEGNVIALTPEINYKKIAADVDKELSD